MLLKRKPVQVAIAVESDGAKCCYVVANDGSLWEIDYMDRWRRLPDIPQPEEETEE